MVTKEQALTAKEFHQQEGAKCFNWRRNGQTKVWKTRPDDFRVPVKFGLYNYDYITPENAHLVHIGEECPNKPDNGDANG